jgi:DNA-binding beta-propeller fold protein YncE
MPDGWKFGRVSAVSTDSANNVYAFQRGPKAEPIVVFAPDGRYLRGWGKGLFGSPHGIRVDRDDNVWVTDTAFQQVMKFSNTGKLLLTLGTKSKPGSDQTTFNRPTDIAFASNGDVYVSDGYANSRIVKFSPEGKFLMEWGNAGRGPGDFQVPHSIAVDPAGLVYVADRENNRIQIFDANGKFLRQWTHVGSPQSLFITKDGQLWTIADRDRIEVIANEAAGGRILHLDLKTGRILGSMESPGHSITVAADGNIFLGNLAGSILRWYPGWPDRGIGSLDALPPATRR